MKLQGALHLIELVSLHKYQKSCVPPFYQGRTRKEGIYINVMPRATLHDYTLRMSTAGIYVPSVGN